MWPDGFAADAADRRAALVLSALRGITPRRLLSLGREHGTASAVLAEIREGRAGGDVDRALAADLDPEEIAAAARACGARIVPWGAVEYPVQLRHVHDPPALLYVVGAQPPDVTEAVAMVGSRGCSPLGRELAREIARAVAQAGGVVVSGAARGIDAAAHEGALAADGRTLAVLGCGPDVVYPRGSRDLIGRIRARGTLMTEHAPGTPPFQRNFPARNRIVAGLCRAAVIVEGAKGSGSMITAEHAMEFGREVFALPGPPTSALSFVPLQLIRDGATMIRGPQDLLEDLGLELDPRDVGERVRLSEEERRVLARLAGPRLPDAIAGELGLGVPEVVGALMRLELRGFVRSVGGRFETTLRGSAASS
ncbi:MAG: DNA-processing protein DprA [Actinomycetota bacterium]